MKSLPFASLLVLAGLASLRAEAQEPALSGLTVEPTPASATSLTPSPGPASSTLSGGKAEIPGTGRGSSLADAVKLSKENRKDQPPKKSLGTITNETLRKGATPTPAAGKGTSGKGTSAKTATGKTARGAASPTPTPGAPDVARDDRGRSEADWRSLVGHQKALVTDGEARVRDLETRTKQLENDFYAMSDGNRRDAVVKPAWDRAREELTRARQELEDARKAVDDLSEDARKSNAPPGWLR
jgi:exonuclease VII small subunit